MDDYWGFFAHEARAIGSALYESLAQDVRGNDELKSLAALARPSQPHANMLFGAVHYLLLRGANHPLRSYYPTLGGTLLDKNLFSVFQDFTREHRDEIAALVATRVTNTNEVGRSAILHPGFRMLAQEIGEPVHLIEIGPSAGLNLVWDRYGVRYRHGAQIVAEISPDAGLVIDCELKGRALSPIGKPPQIASRTGLELNPVDLTKRDDRDWLRALIWPDQVSRLTRLDRAIELFMQNPPSILAGDALALLPGLLAKLPSGPVCVFHTIALYQFSTEMKASLEKMLTEADRSLFRLGLEYDGAGYGLVLSRYRDGDRQDTLLGRAHPHGTWMDWLVNQALPSGPALL